MSIKSIINIQIAKHIWLNIEHSLHSLTMLPIRYPITYGWKSIWRKCVLMGQMHHRHGAIGRLPDFPSPLNPALFSAELKHSKRRKRENILHGYSCQRPKYEIWSHVLLTQPCFIWFLENMTTNLLMNADPLNSSEIQRHTFQWWQW